MKEYDPSIDTNKVDASFSLVTPYKRKLEN